MQLALIIVFLVFIFSLSAAYSYRKLGSLITFYGGNAASRTCRIVRILIALIIGGICANMRHTSAMAALHLLVLFLLFDLLAGFLRFLFRPTQRTRFYKLLHHIYHSGVLPAAVFIILMFYGVSNMNHIEKTNYSVSTVKKIGNYRIALLSDLHYDTIQNRALVNDMLAWIQAQQPDILILAGDIVEENTSKESMEEIFSMVGKIHPTYGSYYVYGNHDTQPYTDEPNYTERDLSVTIQENGIRILNDSYIEISDDLILLGRGDAAWGNTSGRKSTQEILTPLSAKDREEKYIIVVDHQPIEAEENAAAGVDLQLSGHTHAGQLWPIGHITEMRGELNYGMYQRGSCKVIVTSGVAGWGYAFRTQGHCEYVMIDLQKEG